MGGIGGVRSAEGFNGSEGALVGTGVPGRSTGERSAGGGLPRWGQSQEPKIAQSGSGQVENKVSPGLREEAGLSQPWAYTANVCRHS